MTAIEDAMSAILTARAAVYILGSPYEGDPTFDGVIDLLDRARALIEADPGYQRDRADRGRRTVARMEGAP